MALHDAYARWTPYERFLPDPEFPERHFAAIRTEARRKGVTLADPGAFALLEAAAAALDEVRRRDEDPATLPRHASLLFHAFHHHAAGCPLLLVTVSVARHLVEGTIRASGGDGLAPGSYVQLPQHLVWLAVGGGASPVSLDGFYWTRPGDGTLHVLAVAGLLPGRAGFTVVPVPSVPEEDQDLWVEAHMRHGETSDFRTDLPGAELERLYEVRTAGELLKLGARLGVCLDAGALEATPSAPANPAEGEPRPSALEHVLLTLA